MKISRRNFNSFLISASLFSLYPNILRSSNFGGKFLVLIELQGANDGLNTVIPYNDKFYYKLRPNIAIKKKEILTIDENTGLHFSMEGLARLYENGELKIIQNLGYPQPVLSHFRSIELWETGGDGLSKGRDGWLVPSLNSLSKNIDLDAKAIYLDASSGIFKGGLDGYLGPNSIDYNPSELESRDSTIPSLGNENIGLLGELIKQRKENQENIQSMKNKLSKKVRNFRNDWKKTKGVLKNKNYTKPTLRERLFKQIKASSTHGTLAGQWSARKAQLLAKKYKSAGGGYK